MTLDKSKADKRFDKKINIIQFILIFVMASTAVLENTHMLIFSCVSFLAMVALEIRRDLMNIELEIKELNYQMKLNNLLNYPRGIYNQEIPK